MTLSGQLQGDQPGPISVHYTTACVVDTVVRKYLWCALADARSDLYNFVPDLTTARGSGGNVNGYQIALERALQHKVRLLVTYVGGYDVNHRECKNILHIAV